MNLCKNLMKYKQWELEALKKFDNKRKTNGNPFKFLDWFLKNSEQFTDIDKKLSEKVSIEVDAKIKQCYYNTWKGSWNREYKYYEGYLWSKKVPLPIEHSWLVSDGKIIDPTMIIPSYKVKKQLKKYGMGGDNYEGRSFLDDQNEYVGVHIPTDTLNKFVMKSKKTGGFLLEFFLSECKELLVYE